MGAPCVYAVAERLREWLQAHNDPPGSGSGYDEMLKRQRSKAAGGGGGDGGSGGGAYSRQADPSMLHKRVASAGEEDEVLRSKRDDGTPVTPENFMAWLLKFEAEVDATRAEEEAK